MLETQYYRQQYLSDAKNPDGYCGLGGTGVACPTGLVIPTDETSSLQAK